MTRTNDTLDDAGKSAPAYTIATLVNDRTQYAAMCESFRAFGFGDDCEFLPAFHPSSAFAALNVLLARARGRFVIMCHQDVRLIGDGRQELDRKLAELEALDPAWAVAGNAGGAAPGRLAMRISDPHGDNRTLGELPARVMSLDENFLVVKAASRVGFSRDLEGFHLYGADICLVADILGHNSYVIDFHLRHLSPGRKDATFTRAEQAFCAKWSHALRPRWMQTTCTLLRIGGMTGRTASASFISRAYAGVLRRTTRAPATTAVRQEKRIGS